MREQEGHSARPPEPSILAPPLAACYDGVMSSSNAPRFAEPGPFRAEHLRDGDPYELSNGHAIQCMSAGSRHGRANLIGGSVLDTDPKVEGAGVDVGYEFNEGKNLRAPDISVGNVENAPGWAKQAPVLAVEVADTGQDEGELQRKIEELFSQGTKYIWVVRQVGPHRVEVYEQGKKMKTFVPGQELLAPEALANPVPVRALFERDEAHEMTLRNLLNRKGYADLREVEMRGRQEGRDEGHKEGLRSAVLDLCEMAGIEVTPARAQQIAEADAAALTALRTSIKAHRAWPQHPSKI